MSNKNYISEKELESYIKKAKSEYKKGETVKADFMAKILSTKHL